MFDVAKDRLSYGELLRPDVGYRLDFAVGMTYSLDLEALLGVPISLGLLEEGDEEQMRSPLYVLEAIRESAGKIALFCNAGSIQLPQRIQSVYSLLEGSVFQVKRPDKSSFHPKLWVLKYSSPEGDTYLKLLVLSRNLTFDTSLDLCVAMRGKPGRARRKKNKPLADLLTYAAQSASAAKRKAVLDLAEEVIRVAGFEVEHPFEDYTFFPIGIPSHFGKDTGLLKRKRDLFVVSPFLSDDVAVQLTGFRGRKTLITRKASVTPKVFGAFDHVYITKDVLSDNEFGAKQDIHAKLYFAAMEDGNYLYIGSANASHNGFYRNGECLLRLKYKPYQMGFQLFCEEFLPKDSCPFQELTGIPEQPEQDLEREQAAQALREAVYALKGAAVRPSEEHFELQVESAPLELEEAVHIAPLQRRDLTTPLEPNVIFSGLQLWELSAFYILRVGQQSLVVKLETKGIPKERDQAVYRGVIDTRAKFLTYVSMMLSGGEDLEGVGLEQESTQQKEEGTGGVPVPGPAIYEAMLRAFHQDPNRLKGIADMMRRLEPEVVGEEFAQLYAQFEQAARRRRR